VEQLTSFSLSNNFGSSIPYQIVAEMNGMQSTLGTVSSDILTDGSAGTALFGLAGDDVMGGGGGADWLIGGLGNDQLDAFSSNDTYVYARGDGNDTITEDAGNGTSDRLVLQGINRSAVALSRNGGHVTLAIAPSAPGAGDGGSILLKDNLHENFSRGVDQIAFEDGTVWSGADLRLMLLAEASTTGDDVIVGFNTAGTITGGLGNDQLDGSGSNDTYVYARGDGNDTITEGVSNGTGDGLVLEGVNPSAVSLSRNGGHVTLVIAPSAPGAGDGGSILLKDTLHENFGRGVDRIDFADGSSWSRADLRTRWLATMSTDGDDVIDGFNVADVIAGGRGNDTLRGGEGGDTYLYDLGNGADVLYDTAGSTPVDRLVLGPGIAPADATLIRSTSDPDDVTLSFSGGGSVRLDEQFRSNLNGVDFIDFADGTSWNRSAILDAVLA
jgi:Ca2+-binding RTX toxin-like protein